MEKLLLSNNEDARPCIFTYVAYALGSTGMHDCGHEGRHDSRHDSRHDIGKMVGIMVGMAVGIMIMVGMMVGMMGVMMGGAMAGVMMLEARSAGAWCKQCHSHKDVFLDIGIGHKFW